MAADGAMHAVMHHYVGRAMDRVLGGSDSHERSRHDSHTYRNSKPSKRSSSRSRHAGRREDDREEAASSRSRSPRTQQNIHHVRINSDVPLDQNQLNQIATNVVVSTFNDPEYDTYAPSRRARSHSHSRRHDDDRRRHGSSQRRHSDSDHHHGHRGGGDRHVGFVTDLKDGFAEVARHPRQSMDRHTAYQFVKDAAHGFRT